ncbi:MAG: primosomal protein N', partial [Clostridia bacterium]|nr:primosomal protein N' [Clostridia bacterium]
MVAKGLDFPNVTLVGVLGADTAAYSEDFRSFERTFSLLTQVVGRAGRGKNEGKAIVQTIDPQANLIELARKQDYDSFYKEEIMTRKLMTYPPYCDICMVSTSSVERELANEAINYIFNNIKQKINSEYSDIKLMILGPSTAALPKINNRYRFRMMIKFKNSKNFRKMLREAINIKIVKDVRISIDINPETVI